MQTYSHLIVTAALNSRFGPRLRATAAALPPLRGRALLLGSVLPDLPLIGISITTIAWDLATGAFDRAQSAASGADGAAQALGEASLTGQLFDVWFFENPWVIAAYNLFHSPLLVATFMLLGFTAWRRGRRWGAWFFWLSCAALLHTFSDIPLHVDDGPLLLFPLNWELRFRSPLSYWDPAFYGRQWTLFEHALDMLLLLYLGAVYRPLFRAWRERRRTAKTLDNPGALEAPGS